MKIESVFFCDYPIIREESELPLYLLNMGQHHCQDHIARSGGYPKHQILYCTKGSGTLLLDGRKVHIPSLPLPLSFYQTIIRTNIILMRIYGTFIG